MERESSAARVWTRAAAVGGVLFAGGVLVGAGAVSLFFVALLHSFTPEAQASGQSPRPSAVPGPVQPPPVPAALAGACAGPGNAPLPPLPAAARIDPDAPAPRAQRAAPCSFSAGNDPIAVAVRDALRPQEREIRYCALALHGSATARFSFAVAAGSAQVSGLGAETATGLESCLRRALDVAFASAAAAPRSGAITVAMSGQAGKERCAVTISAKRDPKAPGAE